MTTPPTGGPDHDGLTGQPIPPLPDLTDEERAAFLAEAEPTGDAQEPAEPVRSPVILGHGWMDENGDVWRHEGNARARGEVREVLLVSPEAWARRRRVAEEAEAFVACWREEGGASPVALAAAVDAMVSVTGQVGEGMAPAAASSGSTGSTPAAAEPVPEPVSGPGWTDACIRSIAVQLRAVGGPVCTEAADEVEALLADQERLRECLGDGIDPTTIPEQRAKGWTDFAAEDYCHRCGRPNVWAWFTEAELWNRAEGDEGGILCPTCFTRDYERVTGQKPVWRIVPEEMSDHMAYQRGLLNAATAEIHELRAELATARRDAGADVLVALADELDRDYEQQGQFPVDTEDLRRRAKKLRRGDLGQGDKGVIAGAAGD